MSENGHVSLALPVTDELVEVVANRVLELLETHSRADDGWLRGAVAIGAYIDAPPSRVYALNSARRIPIEHDGSALVAKRSDLDAWVLSGGGKRP